MQEEHRKEMTQKLEVEIKHLSGTRGVGPHPLRRAGVRRRRTVGPGRLRRRQRPRPAEGRTPPPPPPQVGRAGVLASLVEHPSDGCAVGGDRLHPRAGLEGVHPAGRRAAPRVGPRLGRHRTGTIADGVEM